jgi:hypothetical protein
VFFEGPSVTNWTSSSNVILEHKTQHYTEEDEGGTKEREHCSNKRKEE